MTYQGRTQTIQMTTTLQHHAPVSLFANYLCALVCVMAMGLSLDLCDRMQKKVNLLHGASHFRASHTVPLSEGNCGHQLC